VGHHTMPVPAAIHAVRSDSLTDTWRPQSALACP
jgi:hypothetical protein